jgi:hypothetical protein
MPNVIQPPPVNMASVEKDKSGSLVFTSLWRKWLIELAHFVNSRQGSTAVIPTAKRTAGGVEGSMTFVDGLLVEHKDAT